MSETVIETAECAECGAEIRDGSLFCYSCGKPVRNAEIINEPKPDQPKAEEPTPDKPKIVEQTSSRPPLRSAASLRKQRRAFNRQPVEVSWERRTGSPIAFVVATIVLVSAALVFLLLALYLR
jgi:hypothetical protein